MDIATMIRLYQEGQYSPLNVYLGLVARLKSGQEPLDVLGTFPADLLATIKLIAGRHHGVSSPADLDEWEISGRICTWTGGCIESDS